MALVPCRRNRLVRRLSLAWSAAQLTGHGGLGLGHGLFLVLLHQLLLVSIGLGLDLSLRLRLRIRIRRRGCRRVVGRGHGNTRI
jgi:hypothetical protein